MALHFALRPRLRLAEVPERPRAVQLPPVALPVVAYWIVMGLLTYGVSRAPAWLEASRGAPSSPAASPRAQELAPLPARAPAARQLELGPTWKDTPREAAPAVAPRPPVEPEAAATLALGLGDEQRPGLHEHRANGRRRSPATGKTEVETRTPSEWPLVAPPPPPVAPPERDHDRDRVAMRSTLDDLWGNPGEDGTPHPSTEQRPTEGHAVQDEPGPRAPARAALVAAGSRVASCESVLARATDEIDMNAGRGPRDLTREAYAAILETGSYLAACAVSAGTAVEVCAAVQNGRALGVTVISRPSDARVNACIRGSVASLAFPANARLDVTRTRFGAVR